MCLRLRLREFADTRIDSYYAKLQGLRRILIWENPRDCLHTVGTIWCLLVRISC
jgi:hypothetical protein